MCWQHYPISINLVLGSSNFNRQHDQAMSAEKQQVPAGDDGKYPMRTIASLTGVNLVTLRAWERRYGRVQPQLTSGAICVGFEMQPALHQINEKLLQTAEAASQ